MLIVQSSTSGGFSVGFVSLASSSLIPTPSYHIWSLMTFWKNIEITSFKLHEESAGWPTRKSLIRISHRTTNFESMAIPPPGIIALSIGAFVATKMDPSLFAILSWPTSEYNISFDTPMRHFIIVYSLNENRSLFLKVFKTNSLFLLKFLPYWCDSILAWDLEKHCNQLDWFYRTHPSVGMASKLTHTKYLAVKSLYHQDVPLLFLQFR